jgi:hypothetical protein
MTNPTTNLLTRFAAAAEKLRGTGAPEVYEWILPFEEYGDLCDGIECQHYDNYAYNPEAALAGYVMWAIKVYGWAWHTGKYDHETYMHHMRFTEETYMAGLVESIADAVGGG